MLFYWRLLFEVQARRTVSTLIDPRAYPWASPCCLLAPAMREYSCRVKRYKIVANGRHPFRQHQRASSSCFALLALLRPPELASRRAICYLVVDARCMYESMLIRRIALSCCVRLLRAKQNAISAVSFSRRLTRSCFSSLLRY